ncbi:MAG TPA: serine/threonine-protein kinase [Nocardioidaceae bacterium]|jgi:serine/threonine-protein kinase|nr:serine/threonine-protein kinase [Nocardioidaceae bacterium]
MATMPLVGDELAGYRLVAVLERGGMSVVYQAEHPRLGSVVALKVLAPELAADDVFRTRFLQESRIAASLNHPNVIPIFDTGSHGDLLYIAMRYVGDTLRGVLRARHHLMPTQALVIVEQTARALDHAHRHGLVHRDVKPANILIERGPDEDDPDHVYLADFGISKHALSRSGLTPTGQFLGTLDYVAPEQIQGRAVDGQADLYSLGCVLYETLTGRVPFVKDVDAAVLWAHVEEPPPPPSTLREALPVEIDAVLARALAKEPAERYSSCREMVRHARSAFDHPDLERVTVLPPKTTAPPPSVPRPGPSVHRPPPSVPRPRSAPEPAPRAVPAGSADLDAVAPAGAAEPPIPSPRPAADVQPPAMPPPPSQAQTGGPGRRRRAFVVVGAAVAALVVAGGVWFGLRQASASHSTGPAKPVAETSMQPSMGQSAGPLRQAMVVANRATGGYLPLQSCMFHSDTHATCDHPHFAVSTVNLQTFGSLNTLYAEYVARVKTVSGGSYRQNVGGCSPRSTSGESSWNHNYQHPKRYSLAQLRSGNLTDDQAAGRLFCTVTNGQLYVLWTDNVGMMLGELTGFPHVDAYKWWRHVHHNLEVVPMPGMPTGQ